MNGPPPEEGMWAEPRSGRRLAYRLWRPETPRSLLVVVHGYGEHGGRYAEFAASLVQQRLAVAVPDLWGHGRSGGPRGGLGRLEDSLRDLEALTEQVFLAGSDGARYAVFGHSFGALLAVLLASRQPPRLERLVVQSPIFGLGFAVPWWRAAAAWCAGVCWPTLRLPTGLPTDALCRDPDIVAAYRRDPLVHAAMSAGTYQDMRRGMAQALAQAGRLRVPVLLVQGGADRIISAERVTRWFDALECEKQRVIFPDGSHELHHEPVRFELARLIGDWVLPPGAQPGAV